MKQNKTVLLVRISIIAVFVLSACTNTSATENVPLDYTIQSSEESINLTKEQNDIAHLTDGKVTLLDDTEKEDNFAEEPSENLLEDTEQSPYVIATTIEEIENILTLQDGGIPVTNIEVTASSLGFPNGVIITITEQDLQDALDVLNEAYKLGSFLVPTYDFITPFIEFTPSIVEMSEGELLLHFRMFVMDIADKTSNFERFNDQFTDEERDLVNAEGERLLAEYGRNAMFEEETLYNTALLVFGERFDFE
ncbi:MAG: hypothetical protein FWG68_05080 [Defluviitaleaceae bacterium]|nr:hypothetical protein [Defluviitaleaceae bacterium]